MRVSVPSVPPACVQLWFPSWRSQLVLPNHALRRTCADKVARSITHYGRAGRLVRRQGLMSKNTSIVVLLATLACIVAAVLLLSRPSESDVYLAVLSRNSNSSIVLASNASTCGLKSGPVVGIPDKLLANFLSANAPGTNSISLSALNGHYALADSAQLNRYVAASISPSVALRGQHDLIRLSRVGFNSDGSEALFCAEAQEGGLFHVRMQNGHWHLVKFVSIWES